MRLVLGGLSAVKVGQKYGDSPRAVTNWVQRFKKDGVGGLHESPHPGRPSTISPAQMRKLKTFVTSMRVRSETMSGRILSEFIKKSFAVTITRQQARRILNKLGA